MTSANSRLRSETHHDFSESGHPCSLKGGYSTTFLWSFHTYMKKTHCRSLGGAKKELRRKLTDYREDR
jgi:hypothetical protein